MDPGGRGWTIEKARNGLPIALWNGRALHSRFDPVREADKAAAGVPKEADIVVLAGFGLGYVAESLVRGSPHRRLIIAEADPEIPEKAMKARGLSDAARSSEGHAAGRRVSRRCPISPGRRAGGIVDLLSSLEALGGRRSGLVSAIAGMCGWSGPASGGKCPDPGAVRYPVGPEPGGQCRPHIPGAFAGGLERFFSRLPRAGAGRRPVTGGGNPPSAGIGPAPPHRSGGYRSGGGHSGGSRPGCGGRGGSSILEHPASGPLGAGGRSGRSSFGIGHPSRGVSKTERTPMAHPVPVPHGDDSGKRRRNSW